MKPKKILTLTLEECGYKLSDYIYASEGLESAIIEAMERYAKLHHEDKVMASFRKLTKNM